MLRRPSKSKKKAFGLFSKFKKDEKGVTAIEFGLVAFPFFATLFAIIEIGLVFFAELMIDNGLNQAARLIRTGQALNMSQQEFKERMCENVFLVQDCLTSVTLDVRSFDDFGNIALPDMVSNGQEMQNPSYDPGSRRSVVVVRAVHGWDLIIPSITNLGNMGSVNKRYVVSSATFRNEPF